MFNNNYIGKMQIFIMIVRNSFVKRRVVKSGVAIVLSPITLDLVFRTRDRLFTKSTCVNNEKL